MGQCINTARPAGGVGSFTTCSPRRERSAWSSGLCTTVAGPPRINGDHRLVRNPGLFRQAATGPEQCIGKTMKYMLMFWVDESAEVTADDDAAMMIAVKAWVEQMTERGVRLYGGPLRSAGEAKIVHVRDGELLVSDGPFAET